MPGVFSQPTFFLTAFLLLQNLVALAQLQPHNAPRSVYHKKLFDAGGLIVCEGTSFISRSNGLVWENSPISWPSGARNITLSEGRVQLVSPNPPLIVELSPEENTPLVIPNPPDSLFSFLSHAARFGDTLLLSLTWEGLARTTDNGQTWELVYQNIENPISSLIIRGETIWTESYLKLLKSENYGEDWQEIPLEDSYYLVDITDSAIITRRSQSRYKISYDEGATWQETSWNTLFNDIYSIFWREGYLYCSHAGGLSRSDDNGNTWELFLPPNPAYQVEDILIRGSEITLSTGSFLKSYDEGEHWFSPSSFPQKPGGFYFSSQAGMLVGYFYPHLHFSTDGGKIWRSLTRNFGYSTNFIMRYNGGRLALFSNGLHFSEGDATIWEKIPVANLPIISLPFVMEGRLYGEGDSLTIYESTDDGLNWSPAGAFPAGTRSWTITRDTAYALTNEGKIYATSQFENEWQFLSNLPGPVNTSQLFSSDEHLYYQISDDRLYHSIDGLDWEQIPFPAETEDHPYQIIVNGGEIFIDLKPDFNSKKFFYSKDYGNFWVEIDPSELVPAVNRQQGDIAVIHEDKLYLTGNDRVKLYSMALEKIRFPTGQGKVFEDLNNNQVQDPGEPSMPGLSLAAAQSGTFSTTNSTGRYFISLPDGPDTVRLLANLPHATITPEYHIANEGQGYDFAVHFEPGLVDWEADVSTTGVFRPGFTTQVCLNYFNHGTETYSDTLKLYLPEDLELFSTTVPASFQEGDTLMWLLDSIPRFEGRRIKLSLGVPADAGIGSLIQIFTYIPYHNDIKPENNSSLLHQTVVGSFDPNDKQVFPGNYTIEDYLAKAPLDYMVRFQNTGTYYASFVRIEDTLSQRLDLSSLKVVSGSHPFTYEMQNGRRLVVYFDNIYLPDSLTNETESHGYIKFSILPGPGLQAGDTISNRAGIYFDFNEPIYTGTVHTVLEMPSATGQPWPEEQMLKVFPNPASGSFTIEAPDEGGQRGLIRVFSPEGRQVLARHTASGTVYIEMEPHWQSGVYFIRWRLGSKVYQGKALLRY